MQFLAFLPEAHLLDMFLDRQRGFPAKLVEPRGRLSEALAQLVYR
jgi:hypothetical protein